MPEDLHRYRDAEDLGGGAALALAARLRLLTSTRAEEAGPVELGVSGGFATAGVLARVDPTGIIWPGVRVWWVDERFVSAGDPQRNDSEAVRALFERTPGVDLRPMPADTGQGLEEARAAFAAQWDTEMRGRRLDVALVGMGPDGHVASLFPRHVQVGQAGPVLAESDSPKPPSARITLALPVLRAAREVWVVAAGATKAGALARAFGGAPVDEVPVAGLFGRDTDPSGLTRAGVHPTSWWLDEGSASLLPD